MTISAEDELSEFETGGPSGLRLGVRFLKDQLPSQLIWLLLVGVFLLAQAGLTTSVAWLMEPAIKEVFSASDKNRLILIGLAFPSIFLLRGLVVYLARYLLSKIGLGVVARAQKTMYDHVQGMDVAFFGRYRTASLINRIVGDAGTLRGAITNLVRIIGNDIPLIVGLVVSLFAFDLDLALLAFIVVPLAIFPVVLLSRAARNVARLSLVETGLFGSFMLQAFQNMRLVKIYGAEDFERARVWGKSDSLFHLALRQMRVSGVLNVAMEIIVGIAFSTIAVYGGYRILSGTLAPQTLAAFVMAAYLVYRPLRQLGRLAVNAQTLAVVLRRYYGLLDLKPDIRQKPNAPPLAVSAGEIVLENISLSYPGDPRPALEHLDLRIPAGRTVALVGKSGAGKSSVLSLIVRFYDPGEGRVLIDGQDIREVTFRSLWETVTMVSQDVVLFDDTVRANIAFGRPGASDEEIEQAARKAAIHDFIVSLPEGYETFVGEDGTRLSGGQRQRISIARAMLKDAPILLLDEATSALDTESERLVRQAFDRAREGRTCLVVAHRLSTIRNADVIHVLDGGRLVDSGTHDALMKRCPLYVLLCAEDQEGPSGP